MSDLGSEPRNVRRDQVVRIAELATATSTLRELVFENCEILGPAVLGIGDNNQFRGSSFEGPESIWDVPADRGYIGAISIDACLFEECRFRRIGWIGPPEVIAELRQSLGIAAPPT